MIRINFVLLMLLFVDSGVELQVLKEKPNQQFQSEEQIIDHPLKRRDLPALPAVTDLLPTSPVPNILNSFIQFVSDIFNQTSPPPTGTICPCNHTNQTMTKRGIKDDNDDVQFRILGGSPTETHEYPQMGQLVCDVAIVESFCGCTIINELFVLTAAHCITGKNETVRVNKCNVTVGTRYSVYSNQSEPTAKTIAVKQIFVHDRFNDATFANDIAILLLNESVEFNQNVKPTCLSLSNATYSCKTLTGVGWGITTANGTETSDVLRAVNVTGVSNPLCAKAYQTSPPPILISDKQICAGDPEGKKDTCSGDSGGPLFVAGTSVQIGITSFGNGCADPSYPGVYTNISAFYLFIVKYTTVVNGCQIYSNDMPPQTQ